MGISEEMLLTLGSFPFTVNILGDPRVRRESFIGKKAKKAHKK